MRGGFNNNHNAPQFLGACRQLVIHHEIKSSENANCNLESDIPILCVPSTKANTSANEAMEIDFKNKFNLESTTIPSQFVQDVVDYIGGFVVMKKGEEILGTLF